MIPFFGLLRFTVHEEVNHMAQNGNRSSALLFWYGTGQSIKIQEVDASWNYPFKTCYTIAAFRLRNPASALARPSQRKENKMNTIKLPTRRSNTRALCSFRGRRCMNSVG